MTTTTATRMPANRPRPGNLTTAQKALVAIAVTLVTVIAGIGFAGSYAAVSHLAEQKGFGSFARVFPLGLDAGIGAFLALDLLLTWLRMPFPLLRYGAWVLTIATVSFNASVAWPDSLGVGMHAVIPILFVIAVEAARHAVGRIADITADKHIEFPPLKRWIIAPWPTYRLWRRQLLWQIRSYDDVIEHERARHVYRARLRARYGPGWRRKATADELLVLTLARGGLTISQAIALPEEEAQAREEEARQRQADRDAEREEREQQQRALADAAERAARERRRQEEEDERERLLKDEQTRAEIAAIQRAEQAAQDETARARAEEQAAAAERQAAAERAAAEAAAERLRIEQQARQEAERRASAEQRTAEIRAALVNQANHEPREPRTANQQQDANREPRTSRREPAHRTTNPANLGDRSTAKRTQMDEVLNLISELGYEATTLSVVRERTGMTKTTAYHRLTEARDIWNQRQAS